MLDFFSTDLGEYTIIAGFIAVFLLWEYAAFAKTSRFWMWAAGLTGIAVMVWLKDPETWWAWLLACGWFVVLVYCDRRLTGRA